MKCRKKPVVVDAVKMLSCGFSATPEWVINALSSSRVYYTNAIGTNFIRDGFIVQTPEVNMRGKIGDYLIQGIDGELYPCKGDIFDKAYEAVEEDKI